MFEVCGCCLHTQLLLQFMILKSKFAFRFPQFFLKISFHAYKFGPRNNQLLVFDFFTLLAYFQLGCDLRQLLAS
jgi:hypothetical protein